jgi:hypothetical protein
MVIYKLKTSKSDKLSPFFFTKSFVFVEITISLVKKSKSHQKTKQTLTTHNARGWWYVERKHFFLVLFSHSELRS